MERKCVTTNRGSKKICNDGRWGPSESEFVKRFEKKGHEGKSVKTDKGSKKISDDGRKGPSKCEFQQKKVITMMTTTIITVRLGLLVTKFPLIFNLLSQFFFGQKSSLAP